VVHCFGGILISDLGKSRDGAQNVCKRFGEAFGPNRTKVAWILNIL
jgi:hypothetical protein